MFQAQGDRGRLVAVYAQAATLGPWSASCGETLGRVTRFQAQVRASSDLLLRHRPLVIALPFGAHEWRWTLDDDLHVSDGTLHARSHGAPVVYPREGQGHGV